MRFIVEGTQRHEFELNVDPADYDGLNSAETEDAVLGVLRESHPGVDWYPEDVERVVVGLRGL